MAGKDTVNSTSRGGKALAKFAEVIAGDRTRKIFRAFDPFYWLSYLLCWPVLNNEMETSQTNVIELNIEKYRFVLWVNFIFGIIASRGFFVTEKGDITVVLIAITAPTIVLGGAWFSISFGGVPDKLLKAAVSLTKWLFVAFCMCLITAALAITHIASIEISIVFIAVVLIAIFSAITYDNLDSLKIGLDDTLRRQSLTALAKLGSEGYWPPIENEENLLLFMSRLEKELDNIED